MLNSHQIDQHLPSEIVSEYLNNIWSSLEANLLLKLIKWCQLVSPLTPNIEIYHPIRNPFFTLAFREIATNYRLRVNYPLQLVSLDKVETAEQLSLTGGDEGDAGDAGNSPYSKFASLQLSCASAARTSISCFTEDQSRIVPFADVFSSAMQVSPCDLLLTVLND